MSYREDLDAYLEACCREDRKDRRDDLRAEQQRLKELMNDLLITIREYSEKHERPDEILFVLDNIANAYRAAFDGATDQRIQRPERAGDDGTELPQ